MVANLLERKNKTWTIRTEVASDLIVRVGNFSFRLHKLPMISRSGYMNRLVFQRGRNSTDSSDGALNIQIDNLPGGSKTFESVVKFCYGWTLDLTPLNIAPLYCAARFLEMTDDYLKSNLISRTETFLSFTILSSWKDTFHILKSCESLSPWASEMKILKRCSETIAFQAMACTHPERGLNFRSKVDTWWYEDVSALRIDHFIEVVAAIKEKGAMNLEMVGECIAEWTNKWLSRVTLLDKLTPQKLTYQLQRVTIENLIRLLPLEVDSVPCNFLLKLLKLGLTMEAEPSLVSRIEQRIISMLERCRVVDLLVEDDDKTYDVGIVVKVVKSYVAHVSGKGATKIHAVGRLVDGFIVFVAREKGFEIESFRSLVELLPRNARNCDDSLYRGIDMYLKAHPYLTEEERMSICRALDYHKLSKEAREHAMMNDRLPLSMATRFILLEQVNLTKSMTMGTRSSFQRTRTQTVIRAVNKSSDNGWLNSQKEIRMMKKEVDIMKSQLNKLQVCKMELQVQMKRGVR